MRSRTNGFGSIQGNTARLTRSAAQRVVTASFALMVGVAACGFDDGRERADRGAESDRGAPTAAPDSGPAGRNEDERSEPLADSRDSDRGGDDRTGQSLQPTFDIVEGDRGDDDVARVVA